MSYLLEKKQTAFWVFFLLAGCVQEANTASEYSDADIRLPAGFTIEVLANIPNARSLQLGAEGMLYVSSQRIGKVFAIRNAFSAKPEVLVVAEGLKYPNGLAYKDGDLYVVEPERVLRYRDIESDLTEIAEPEVVTDKLLAGKQHAWKYASFGPDGKLYVTIGSPCNVCNEPDYGVIQRMDVSDAEAGSVKVEVVARGIRNSVGFDWHPLTHELWFTDNNRDMLSDDEPPGELNRVSSKGEHFGFPFCHGAGIVEPQEDIARLGSCFDITTPMQLLGPHVAPLGMAFYTGEQFPEEYKNQVFIAEHGSWNRSEKIGYRVSLVTFENGQAVDYQPFADGWLKDGHVSGRPVDVVVAPDGSLLVSDDRAGKVYRIRYVGDAAAK
jgi:glucose/arabinose dehydrogenase